MRILQLVLVLTAFLCCASFRSISSTQRVISTPKMSLFRKMDKEISFRNILHKSKNSVNRKVEKRRTALDASIGVTLDKSVLPISPFLRFKMLREYGIYACGVILFIRLISIIAESISESNLGNWLAEKFSAVSKYFEDNENSSNILFKVTRKISSLLPALSLAFRIIYAKIMAFSEAVYGVVQRVFDLNPSEEIDIKEWKVCSLYERENLPGGYIRYRFELTDPLGVIPLYIGQELTMCSVDSKDRVFKESFYPVTSRSTRGYFDVILRRERENADSFATSLSSLPIGDELAFKGGKYRLNYMGTEDRINAVTLVASGLGIAPALQVLRSVLPDRDSTVADVEFLWLNENKNDFICNDDVESLEYRYIEKLFVGRIIEKDLFGMNMSKNDEVLGSISPYEPGRIAVICAPDYLISKTRNLLLSIGYPSESILPLSIGGI